MAAAELDGNNNLNYTFIDIFKSCGCTLDDPILAAKLEAFIEEHSVSAKKLVTDSYGKVLFMDLPLGLYFVKQTNIVEGYAPCTSFLVTVPNYNEEGYVYDVNASPKTDVLRLTSITIKKVWNTDASAEVADNVTVQLLRDGEVIETAILNDKNNWQVTYSDMPESDAYSIVEVNNPEGFTATYEKNGYVFTVTNTASLIQTGQLVWPIPVLAMVGLFLIAVGSIVLRKMRNENV